MLGLVAMAILISLSDLFVMERKDLEVVGDPQTKYPVYKALLLALLYPVCVVFFVQFIRMASKLRMNLIDMSMAYFLVSSVMITLPALIIFSATSIDF